MADKPTYKVLEEKVRTLEKEIYQHLKTEEALRVNVEKCEKILETMQEGYYEVDLAGNYLFVNDAILRFYGYTRDEMINTPSRLNTSQDEAMRIFQIFNDVYRTGKTIRGIDAKAITRDGSVKFTELSISLMRDKFGEPVGFRGIAIDRTEQRKAENALRESEEKYRLVVENSKEGIMITQDNAVKFTNSRVQALTGYTKDTLFSMTLLDLIHSEDKAVFIEAQQKKAKTKTATVPYVLRMINKTNDILWIELVSVQVIWEGAPATLYFLRDITLQRKMEAQLLQAAKMEAVGTMAGGIAHDFNNLLMGIQGNTSLILLDTGGDYPHHDKLKSIEQLVQAGSALTRQLLGVGMGGMYEVKPTHLNSIVQSSVDLFARARKEIQVHKKLQEDLWPVEVDRHQIDQVLLNL